MEKLFTYKPRPVTIPGERELTDTGFEGEIKIAIPDYQERLKLIKEQNLGDDAEFDERAKLIYATVSRYVKSIAFEHPDYEEKIEDIESLGFLDIGVAVIHDLNNLLLKGWRPNPKS